MLLFIIFYVVFSMVIVLEVTEQIRSSGYNYTLPCLITSLIVFVIGGVHHIYCIIDKCPISEMGEYYIFYAGFGSFLFVSAITLGVFETLQDEEI